MLPLTGMIMRVLTSLFTRAQHGSLATFSVQNTTALAHPDKISFVMGMIGAEQNSIPQVWNRGGGESGENMYGVHQEARIGRRKSCK